MGRAVLIRAVTVPVVMVARVVVVPQQIHLIAVEMVDLAAAADFPLQAAASAGLADSVLAAGVGLTLLLAAVAALAAGVGLALAVVRRLPVALAL
jgi:hypothetical protein